MNNDCYNYPKYWDFSFRDETEHEADFLEAVLDRYVLDASKSSAVQRPRLLEPGCGGGRLIVEMARRGYNLTGFDLSRPSIDFLAKRLHEQTLSANVSVADMRDFHFPEPFDLAFCTFNTFRHLLTESDAVAHLKRVAESLRTGGVYVLGFHLIPLDADEEDEETWTEQDESLCVTNQLEVVAFDRARRRETLRFTLDVQDGESPSQRIVSEYEYRLYTDTQFRRTLDVLPEFELVEVFDFNYDIEDPVDFDNELSDAVFILRRT